MEIKEIATVALSPEVYHFKSEMPILHLPHSTCFSHNDKKSRVCSPKGEIQKFLYDCKGSLTCLALQAFLGQSHMHGAAAHIQVRFQLAPHLSNADLVLQLPSFFWVQYHCFQVAYAPTNSLVNSQAKDRPSFIRLFNHTWRPCNNVLVLCPSPDHFSFFQ